VTGKGPPGGDQAVETWRIVEPVLRAWREDTVPLQEYEAGSDGPATLPLPNLAVPQRLVP